MEPNLADKLNSLLNKNEQIEQREKKVNAENNIRILEDKQKFVALCSDVIEPVFQSVASILKTRNLPAIVVKANWPDWPYHMGAASDDPCICLVLKQGAIEYNTLMWPFYELIKIHYFASWPVPVATWICTFDPPSLYFSKKLENHNKYKLGLKLRRQGSRHCVVNTDQVTKEWVESILSDWMEMQFDGGVGKYPW